MDAISHGSVSARFRGSTRWRQYPARWVVGMIKRLTSQCLHLDLRTSRDLVSSHMGIVQTNAAATRALESFARNSGTQLDGGT